MKLRTQTLHALPLLVLSLGISHASTLLSEGFNDITTLGGSGWAQINNSTAGGASNWFQGVPAAFNAQAGPTNSYIAANFNNAGFGGNISNWLILPTLTLNNGDTLTFWTRTETNPFPGDMLEVLLSTNGSSTNVGSTPTSVGDFTTTLTTIGTSGYPADWTQFTSTVSGLAGPTSARLAFRYVVTDTSASGDFIGIDTVTVDSAGVPEPGTLLMLGAGVALIAGKRIRAARAA